MIDVSISYDRYKFLGYEFLTWLWFSLATDMPQLEELKNELVSLEIGNRMVLENHLNQDSTESVTIKGDDAGLEEGMLALKKGAVVTEMNLIYKSGAQEWRFTIKGESFDIGNLKPPETGNMETKEDMEGVILEKVYLYEKAILLIDILFKYFIQLRISKDWDSKVVPDIRKWISSRS